MGGGRPREVGERVHAFGAWGRQWERVWDEAGWVDGKGWDGSGGWVDLGWRGLTGLIVGVSGKGSCGLLAWSMVGGR